MRREEERDEALARSWRVLDEATPEDNERTAAMLRAAAERLPDANRRRIALQAAEWFEAQAAEQVRKGAAD